MPGAEDVEAFGLVKTLKIDARIYPHSFFWYSMISKFKPEKLPKEAAALYKNAGQAKPAAKKNEEKPAAAKDGAAKGKDKPAAAAKGKGKPAAPKEVSDIGMMDLRVGKIVEVWKHPDSQKLLRED